MTILKQSGYALTTVCDFSGISRQGYYKRIKSDDEKAALYNSLESMVIANRNIKSRAGLRTIYHKEKMKSLIGINQYEAEMSARGHALKPYRSYIKTTDSRGHHYKYDNIVFGLKLSSENQVIVGDITYFRAGLDLYYIFHFVDFYTLEVKGLIANTTMEGIYAEQALRQVITYNKKKKYNYTLFIHTDGGGQYRSNKFQQMLTDAQIRPSQAKVCFENGLSERLNGIIKNEYLNDYEVNNVKQLNKILKKVKYDINEVWPSALLGYKTPKVYASEMRNIKENERRIKEVK
jgi:transposase InsO family protein